MRKKRLLVLGPSVPNFLHNNTDYCVLHHPLIALRASLVSNSDLHLLSRAERLIITSKHAVSFLNQALTKAGLTTKSNYVYCVGKASAQAAHIQFPSAAIKIASNEQQEGVIDMIIKDRPKSVAWPRSTKARSLLSTTLLEEGIDLIDVPLYEPFATNIYPSLTNIDEVFFSSPSTVDAFFALFTTQEMSYLSFSAIGPITKNQLHKKGISYVRIYSSGSSI
jgi:uroporphyrinogen-III synthase